MVCIWGKISDDAEWGSVGGNISSRVGVLSQIFSKQIRTRVVFPDLTHLLLKSDRKSTVVQENGNNYSKINSKGVWAILLGRNRARKCRTSEFETEAAQAVAGNQKSKNPGIQWHGIFGQWRNNSPVSQWVRTPDQRANESKLVSHWATAKGIYYRKWSKLCICKRYGYRRQVKMFSKIIQIHCSENHTVLLSGVTNLRFITFQ